MNFELNYTNLGHVFIVILVILILHNVYNMYLNKKRKEGFLGIFADTNVTKDDEDSAQTESAGDLEALTSAIKKSTAKSITSMNLIENRKDWEDLIIAVEDKLNIISLSSMVVLGKMIKSDPDDDKLLDVIKRLNEISAYRKNLNDTMTYLDGIKN